MAHCKITILVDNLPAPNNPLLKHEHGLSMLVEVGGWRMLCDMGASSAYAVNAERLNIDLHGVDAAFLSHAHNDHTGGLHHFLTAYSGIPVYMSASARGVRCYSSRRSLHRDISMDNSLIEHYPERFCWIADSCWITPSLALVKSCSNNYPLPQGNAFLTMENGTEDGLDNFAHELSVAVSTDEGLVVISSCSHSGALNIIQDCIRFTGNPHLKAFVGGLHLVDIPGVEDETTDFATRFMQLYPYARLYTGHCTGEKAKETLSKLFPQIGIFYTGMTIETNA